MTATRRLKVTIKCLYLSWTFQGSHFFGRKPEYLAVYGRTSTAAFLNPYMSLCNSKLCTRIWSKKFVPGISRSFPG